MTHWFFTRHGYAYIYVPNIIGYLRILCSIYAFAVAPSRPLTCVTVYFASFVCDELDGRFARLLNQTSSLGSCLDMVTDRLATAGFLTTLSVLMPRGHLVFLALLMLDIFSHWFQTFAALLTGASTHKDVHSRSFVVRFYYKSRIFMGFCCICCEVLYLCLYLLQWERFSSAAALTLSPPKVFAPHLGGDRISLSWPALVAILAVPGFLTKQYINAQQLRMAMRILVQYDRDRNSKVSAAKRAPVHGLEAKAGVKLH